MTIYLIVCTIMIVLTVLRIFAEVSAFLKAHPGIKFQKLDQLQSFCAWARFILIFLIPIANLAMFVVVFFVFTEKDFEAICWKCVEGD